MGGAIFNGGGAVTIVNSTFATNSAVGGNTFGAGGGNGNGGAIFSIDGDLTLINDTFAHNTVAGGTWGSDGSGSGSAVYNLSLTAGHTSTLTAANTIFGDATGSSDVVNDQYSGTATINATGPNIVVTSVDNIGGTMTGTSFTIANPDLGQLEANGGPTRTFALNPGSPAIDAGSNAVIGSLTTDQRGPGFDRVVNGTVDIGAFEVQTTPLPSGRTPLLESGSQDAQAELFLADASGQYGSSAVATLNPFGNFDGDVRTTVADVNGDGIPDIILVTGPGTPMQVAVVNGWDDSSYLVPPIEPFGADYTDGGFVSAGDFDNSGRAAFVVSPDNGGGPRVRIYELAPTGLVTKADFFGIADVNFRGGARTAIGDVNGDGTPDLVVAAGFGGGPRIAVYDGEALFTNVPTKLLGDFFAFESSLRNGAYVSVGDIDGDGLGDIAFGAGAGGAPRVLAINGSQLINNGAQAAIGDPMANFFVDGNFSNRGGVRIALKNVDGDDLADLAVGSGQGDPGLARVYLGKNITPYGEPTAFQDIATFGTGALVDGVFVG